MTNNNLVLDYILKIENINKIVKQSKIFKKENFFSLNSIMAANTLKNIQPIREYSVLYSIVRQECSRDAINTNFFYVITIIIYMRIEKAANL